MITRVRSSMFPISRNDHYYYSIRVRTPIRAVDVEPYYSRASMA